MMKKVISLLMVLGMCIAFCACGNSATADPESTHENDSTVADEPDFVEVLMNSGVTWGYVNRMAGYGFIEDGTTTSENETWTLDGDTVKITRENGAVDAYRFVELNGVYYLMGERDTMYSEVRIRYDEIPRRAVEITLDNWQEYFEMYQGSEELFDQFGEPTGEIREYDHLRLKDECSRIFLYDESEVLLRYTQNGSEHDARIDDGHTYIDLGDLTEYPLEMVKIQGTLYFVDGL